MAFWTKKEDIASLLDEESNSIPEFRVANRSGKIGITVLVVAILTTLSRSVILFISSQQAARSGSSNTAASAEPHTASSKSMTCYHLVILY